MFVCVCVLVPPPLLQKTTIERAVVNAESQQRTDGHLLPRQAIKPASQAANRGVLLSAHLPSMRSKPVFGPIWPA